MVPVGVKETLALLHGAAGPKVIGQLPEGFGRLQAFQIELRQSSLPLAELDGGVWRQGGYSGYRLCDWAGEQRVDAFYENGGRLRSFVFVDENGNETEYIAGEVRQK